MPLPNLTDLPPAPLPSDVEAEFDAKAYPLVAGLVAMVPELRAFGAALEVIESTMQAAAAAADLPDMAGQAGRFFRVNDAGDGVEFGSLIAGNGISVDNSDGAAGDATVRVLFANQAQAEAGTAGLLAMDPQRTKQAIVAQLNAPGSPPLFACRAWVNFNGTGTVAIKAGGNVSSVTDAGVGRYDVNFTTAMPDVNYALTFGSTVIGFAGQDDGAIYFLNKTTSSFRVLTLDGGSDGEAFDADEVCVSVVR